MEQLKTKHVKKGDFYHIVMPDELSEKRTNYSYVSIVIISFLIAGSLLLFLLGLIEGGLIRINFDNNNSVTNINNKTELNIAPFCNGSMVYCDNTSYPSEKILEILSKNNVSEQFPTKFDKTPKTVQTVEERPRRKRSLDDDAENACQVHYETIQPKVAMNTRGKYQFIVNTPEINRDYVQQLRIALCTNPGEECLDGECELSGYETVCVQQMMEVDMVTVEEGKDIPVLDTFKFPSGCSCAKKPYGF